jgi:repressor LexA
MTLTKRQQDVLDFIKKEIRTKGYPPSVREIGAALGLSSSSTVHGHLERLEKKGYIRRDPSKSRTIEVLDKEEQSKPKGKGVPVPLLRKVKIGIPITAAQNIEEYFLLPEQFLPSSEDKVFLLRVEGNRLINTGILNGDLVIVRQQLTARNGEIVVAMTEDGTVTVNRFYKEKQQIRLQPENPDLEPLYLNDVYIIGKVVGCYRQFIS